MCRRQAHLSVPGCTWHGRLKVSSSKKVAALGARKPQLSAKVAPKVQAKRVYVCKATRATETSGAGTPAKLRRKESNRATADVTEHTTVAALTAPKKAAAASPVTPTED